MALGSGEECEMCGKECQVVVVLVGVDDDAAVSVVQVVTQVLKGENVADLVLVAAMLSQREFYETVTTSIQFPVA